MENTKESAGQWSLAGAQKKIVTLLLIGIGLFILIFAGNIIFSIQGFNWLQFKVEETIGLPSLVSGGIAALVLAILCSLPIFKMLRAFSPLPQKNKWQYRSLVFLIISITLFATYLFQPDPFFDKKTGAPLKYYSISMDGEYNFYPEPGFDPETGDTLKPVTREIVAKYYGESDEGEEEKLPENQNSSNAESLPKYRGAFVNHLGISLKLFVGENNNDADNLNFIDIIPPGDTVYTSLSEGTHYFTFLDMDGKNVDIYTADPIDKIPAKKQFLGPRQQVIHENTKYEIRFIYYVFFCSCENWKININETITYTKSQRSKK